MNLDGPLPANHTFTDMSSALSSLSMIFSRNIGRHSKIMFLDRYVYRLYWLYWLPGRFVDTCFYGRQLQSGFGAIIDMLQPVMSVINKVCDACKTIQEWFEPFMWVLVSLLPFDRTEDALAETDTYEPFRKQLSASSKRPSAG